MPKGGSRPAFNLRLIKQPSRAHNLRWLLLPGLSATTGKPSRGFETRSGAERERRFRLRRAGAELERSTRNEHRLSLDPVATSAIALVFNALTAADYSSLANPVFVRELRRRLCGELLRLLHGVPLDQVWFYTIASPDWRLPADQLLQLSPRKLRESLRVNLIRYGGLDRLPGWCVCGFHNAYDPTTGMYQPHFHCVSVGEKHLAFEALRKLKMFKGGTGRAVYRPIQCEPARNIVRQITYILKSYVPSQARYRDLITGEFRQQRRHRRMPEPHHTLALALLHQLRFSDIVWLHGLDLRNGRLCPR